MADYHEDYGPIARERERKAREEARKIREDELVQNAAAWRDLYNAVTNEYGIPHTAETVQVEGQFRRLMGDV